MNVGNVQAAARNMLENPVGSLGHAARTMKNWNQDLGQTMGERVAESVKKQNTISNGEGNSIDLWV
ncbi:MAG: hypothetical protein ACLFV7_07235 [Phycisphaerae bacterium]